MEDSIEMEMDGEVEVPRKFERDFVMCKLYMPNFERKAPPLRIRLFKLPLIFRFTDLKAKISEMYEKTYFAKLDDKKGVDVMFRDHEKELIVFDTEEEWEHIKELVRLNVINILKIQLDYDKFSPSKEKFLPRMEFVSREQPVVQQRQVQPFVQQPPQGMQIPQEQPTHSSMMYPAPGSERPVKQISQERVMKIQRKLNEMGFRDNSKNLVLIRHYGGDLNLILSSGSLHPSTN